MHSQFRHAANYVHGKNLVSVVDPSIGAGPLNIVVEKDLSQTYDRVVVGNGCVMLVPFQLRDIMFAVRSGMLRRDRVRHPSPPRRIERIARGLAQHDGSIGQIQTQLFETAMYDCIYECAPVLCYDSSLPDLDFRVLKNSLPNFKRLLIELAPAKSIAFLLDESEESNSAVSFEAALRNQFLKGAKLMRERRILEGVRTIKGLGFGLTPSGDDFISGFLLGLNLQQRLLNIDHHRLIEDIFVSAQTENLLSLAWLRCAKEGRIFEKMKQAIIALGQMNLSIFEKATRSLLTVGSTSGIDMAVGLVFGIETVCA
jgi:hypothetical protein